MRSRTKALNVLYRLLVVQLGKAFSSDFSSGVLTYELLDLCSKYKATPENVDASRGAVQVVFSRDAHSRKEEPACTSEQLLTRHPIWSSCLLTYPGLCAGNLLLRRVVVRAHNVRSA